MKRIPFVLAAVLSIFVAGCSIYASPTASAPEAEGISAEWAFTQAGQKPDRLLIGVIDGASSTLDIAIYSLTKPDIVDAIKRAKKRGVEVRIITDRIQSGGKSQQEALKLLGSAGIPMKRNTHSGLMHLKMTIADGKTATTGSFNYSKSASTDNDEVLMVLRNEDVARSFERQFQAMWEDTSGFTAISPKIADGSADEDAGAESAPDAASETDADTNNATNSDINADTNAEAGTSASVGSGTAFRSCAEAKAAGKTPLRKGDPGYSAKLDGDKDGIACEK
ncbi:phospholipase D family protein [Paenibacillus lycopersici]|uniref:phospholipase D n=1 Tax=Paenibacillus lycopersici TaxID=2704462 RepID=A0A6C0FZT6_9BACL|nr:phospholipase D-like domain-containing protein [Paenibacillus lycopersici]QHT62147.1 phospholipase D family protein [Paenibacillus lycopersici]